MNTSQIIVLILAVLGSQGLWSLINKLVDKFSKTSVRKILIEIRLDNERLKILQLIQHCPTEKKAICDEYDTYKNLGGNSYIDAIFNEWKSSAAA
jgi:hypothetical protein